MRVQTRSVSALLCRIVSFCFLSAVCSVRISANCALQASLEEQILERVGFVYIEPVYAELLEGDDIILSAGIL